MTTFSGLFGGGAGSGPVSTPHMGYRSGKYYLAIPIAAGTPTGVLTLTSTVINYAPFYVHSDVSISAICFENSDSAASGRKVRAGIYTNDGGTPGSLEVASPEITLTGSPAAREMTISATALPKGWHWVGFAADGNAQIRSVVGSGYGAGWSLNAFASQPTNTIAGFVLNEATFAYASLPSTAPAPATSNNFPIFWLKAA